MLLLSCSFVLLGAVLTVKAQQPDAAVDQALVAKLITANSQVSRLGLLKDTDFVFNFGAGVGTGKGAGGTVTLANMADMPALTTNGMAMAFAVLQPCGLNPPHTHNRASEFLYSINGTLSVGFINEDGARYISNTVSPGSGTIFPLGSIHFQQNLGCEPAAFVAVFNDADPGQNNVAQSFFGLPPDIAQATLGEIGLEEVVDIALNIPDGPAIGVQSCLTRCNLQRGTQPHLQLQPRVSGNALPPTSSSSQSMPSTSKRSIARRSVEVPMEGATKSTGSSEPVGLEEVVSMLRIVVGIMLVGYVFIGASWILRRRRERVAVVNVPPIAYRDVVKA